MIMTELWEKGKRKVEDGFASDEERPSFKFSKNNAYDDEYGITVCELSRNRRASVRSWKGKTMVDISEFYEKDGKILPGRKGITLTLDQWKILLDHAAMINKIVSENAELDDCS